MKRKKYIFAVAAILILSVVFISFFFQQSKLDGSTLESRELRLNQSDNRIHIASEIKIDEHIISGIIDANNKYGLAIFEPEDNNKYKLQTISLRDNGEIITEHTVINGTGYDLFWYSQAELDYAKVTYAVQGKKLEPIKLDARENKILYYKAPSNDYSVKVAFCDNQGNQYE
ncbi:hypothetical protein Dtox_3416 [Desulfofarcimen acetoxidans DSM 771]|uniref:Uncharacterized protein n=1 Tax=Desulfofarcimen acetoxidans (strain ATCC 49208 / DSM 771 / KCTC 5769 / VKM B-1644 / 5575) TaxID=485916 RepID=C8W6N1_DESAS|nr:hypothetical protein [Desulfofarcimen acetoxidans]ACV64140.1 hypothetical protein Dtox_3416 [Desulfofarcimen acetoxidans DSM 771]